jgi:alpha-tubulin suppressor-like RCC1 family protein
MTAESSSKNFPSSGHPTKGITADPTKKAELNFVSIAQGIKHSIGITADGIVYSWGKTNALGQLGRVSSSNTTPAPVTIGSFKAVRAYVGGSNDDSGHSAILDASGTLWMSGCDRWQQLGLGASEGGSSGYTWRDGKLWQEKFVQSTSVTDLIRKNTMIPSKDESIIRDVALGGDHTLVLASNKRDVYAFGKGGDGQLGLVGKPFVSAPIKSTKLSTNGASAVCAVKACSMVFDEEGKQLAKAGKCRKTDEEITKGIERCLQRASKFGLVR